ncbi:MAG: hypothetical protein D3924_09185 [Candidatus Electrothrix sp. AR4]|nr:hypothetical protein [Candidatus Electrothrix sp. AR4]
MGYHSRDCAIWKLKNGKANRETEVRIMLSATALSRGGFHGSQPGQSRGRSRRFFIYSNS